MVVVAYGEVIKAEVMYGRCNVRIGYITSPSIIGLTTELHQAVRLVEAKVVRCDGVEYEG